MFLYDNFISHRGAIALNQSLSKNTRILDLDIERNSVGPVHKEINIHLMQNKLIPPIEKLKIKSLLWSRQNQK